MLVQCSQLNQGFARSSECQNMMHFCFLKMLYTYNVYMCIYIHFINVFLGGGWELHRQHAIIIKHEEDNKDYSLFQSAGDYSYSIFIYILLDSCSYIAESYITSFFIFAIHRLGRSIIIKPLLIY